MSNSSVGGIYLAVIDEVINSSRVDFEETGVDETVLEALRKGWQQKLSQLAVARFPWDPKPELAPPAPSSPPNNIQPQPPFPSDLSLPVHDTTTIKQEDIKQEPVALPSFSTLNGPDDKVNLAASRAAQRLQLQYGVRAAGSINAIQDRVVGEQQSDEPDDQTESKLDATQESSTPQLHQQAPQPAGNANPDNGQTDGAADGMPTSGQRQPSRVVIDGMLHQEMMASAKAMEAGGLMLALDEGAAARPSRRRAKMAPKGAVSGNKDKGKAIAAFDGVDDDDDVEDEDAINSDLDDSEDENDDDEPDDEGLGHIMLCMYDKVQRVKNKWKCTLKDGVLTVNGKEYVFHKASGEYEW